MFSGGNETSRELTQFQCIAFGLNKKLQNQPLSKYKFRRIFTFRECRKVMQTNSSLHGLVDNMIVLKGQFNLSTESSEDDIRTALVPF